MVNTSGFIILIFFNEVLSWKIHWNDKRCIPKSRQFLSFHPKQRDKATEMHGGLLEVEKYEKTLRREDNKRTEHKATEDGE